MKTAPFRTKEEHQALANQTEDWTLCLHDVKDRNNVASAVAVKIGKRYFLATAGHALKDMRKLAVLWQDGEHPIRELDRFVRYDARMDLGFVEVADASIHEGGRFADADNILTAIDQKVEQDVIVVGFPSGAFVVSHSRSRFGAMLGVLSSRTASLSDWPKDWPGRPSPRRDMFIWYQVNQPTPVTIRDRNLRGSLDSVAQLKTPQGLSGGGIWLCCARVRPVWSPNAQLVGIQVGRAQLSPVLHGYRIGCLLDLVAKRNPALASEVSNIKSRGRLLWRRIAKSR